MGKPTSTESKQPLGCSKRLHYLKRCKSFWTAPTAYGAACAAAMLGDQESMDRLRQGLLMESKQLRVEGQNQDFWILSCEG